MFLLEENADHTAQITTALGQLVLLITFIVREYFNVQREKRHHKWQVEEAQRQQAEHEKHQKQVKEAAENAALEVKKALDARAKEINDRFDKLTEVRNDR
jgi:hypothetical protein